MKTAKKTLAVLLTVCCIMGLLTSAHATQAQAEPRIDTSSSAYASLKISSVGEATCKAAVIAKSLSYRIEINMSICRVINDIPDPLKSWGSTGVYSLDLTKQYYLSKGYDYQVIVAITVRDSSGKLIESFIISSSIVHY